PERRDVVAARVLAQARELGLPLPDGLRSRRGWSLRLRGGEAEARRLAENLLVDPVMNTLRLLSPAQDPRESGGVRLEIGRLPGVMDPSAQSVVRAASRLGLHVQDVRSWQAFVAPAGTDPALLARLGSELLANAAIEEVRVQPGAGVPPVQDLPEAPFRLVH